MASKRGLFRGFYPLIVILALAGCGTPPHLTPPPLASAPQAAIPPTVECVPYARRVSGVAIHGDAWTWWRRAEGRYRRGDRPRRGAVLVWRRTRRLPLGHVAVVERILSPREIVVAHTHWPNEEPGHISRVLDVSADNSWRAVRVWNARADTFGAADLAYGFIYPRRESQREADVGRHR